MAGHAACSGYCVAKSGKGAKKFLEKKKSHPRLYKPKRGGKKKGKKKVEKGKGRGPRRNQSLLGGKARPDGPKKGRGKEK